MTDDNVVSWLTLEQVFDDKNSTIAETSKLPVQASNDSTKVHEHPYITNLMMFIPELLDVHNIL